METDTPKEKAIEDFFRSFKIALNNSTLYFSGHSLLTRSIDDLKAKTESLQEFVKPLIFRITPDSIIIEEKIFGKNRIYGDMAQFFHRRKLKSVKLKTGLTLNELYYLVSNLAVSPRDFFKNGNLDKITSPQEDAFPHVECEELDYTEALKSQAQAPEDKELLPYLLYEAVSKDDFQKLLSFADNFEKFISKFNNKEIMQDEELKENFFKFLFTLKDKARDKFNNCVRETLKAIMADPGSTEGDKLEASKKFLESLKEESFAESSWQEMLMDDNFDSLSFKLFFQLINEKQHLEIAKSLYEKVKDDIALKNNAGVLNKIKELFLVPENSASPYMSEIYRKTLSSLLSEIKPHEGRALDRRLLGGNFHLILLHLLNEERNKSQLSVLFDFITKELSSMDIQNMDFDYLKLFNEVLSEKEKSGFSWDGFERSRLAIADLVEKCAFEGIGIPHKDYFISALKASSTDGGSYLNKIFNEKKVNDLVLSLFLKFFPGELPKLFENLSLHASDFALLEKFIDALRLIDSKTSLQILEFIFTLSNLMKSKVIEAMSHLTVYDQQFIFSILKKGSPLFKLEVLSALGPDEKKRQLAARLLFHIFNPFGVRNSVLLSNMEIAREAGFKEAKEYLVQLSQKKFFWNKQIRIRSAGVLKEMGC